MNWIIYLLFICVFLFDYLAQFVGGAGRLLTWSPELFSLMAAVAVALRVSQTTELVVHPKYIILFIFFLLLVAAGVILNGVQPGAVFSGLRAHFKYFPFFLLPAAFLFSEPDLSAQLKFTLALSLMQVPVTIYQRFVQFQGFASGDPISGTLIISSILSSYLLCVVAVLFAFYLKKRISLLPLLALTAILLFPTTLNATRGTLVLLPFAILVPALVFNWQRHRVAAIIPVIGFVALLSASFIVLFNAHLGAGTGKDANIVEFYLSEEYKKSLLSGAEGGALETREDVGRLDSILLAYQTLSTDATKLLVGLGIGNVTQSFSDLLAGDVLQYYDMGPHITGVSYVLWEMGIVGLLAVIAGYLLVFNDARHLSRADGAAGAVALGWTGVTVIFIISLLYKNFVSHNVMGYVFWYFAGYIAATRLRWEYARETRARADSRIRFQHSLSGTK